MGNCTVNQIYTLIGRQSATKVSYDLDIMN